MPADSNSLTFILQQFLTAFQAGRGAVGVDAFHLLGILATLELTVAAIWWAIVGDDVLVALMKKLLLVGFFVFVVSNYDSLLSTVSLGFIHTGEVAGSAGGGNLVSVTNPSTIVSAGLKASQPIFDHIKQASVFTDLADIVISGVCGVVTRHHRLSIARQRSVRRIHTWQARVECQWHSVRPRRRCTLCACLIVAIEWQ